MRRLLTHSTRHTIILFFEIIAILAVLLIVAVGGLIYRLEQGPLVLGFLQGPLQHTINENLQEYNIRFHSVALTSSGLQAPIELQMSDVEVTDKLTGQPVAVITRMGLEISRAAILVGDIAPKTISFYDIGLRLYQTEKGVSLSVNSAKSEIMNATLHADHVNDEIQAHTGENVLEILKRDLFSQNEERAGENISRQANLLRYLKTVRVVNANILFSGDWLERDIVLSGSDVTLRQTDGQMVAALDADLVIDETRTPLMGHIYYSPDQKDNAASLHFQGLDAQSIQKLLPEHIQDDLTLFGTMKGTAHLGFDQSFKFSSAIFEGSVQDGLFNFDQIFTQAIAFKNLYMIGGYDAGSQSFTFEEIKVSEGDFQFLLSGESRYETEKNTHRLFVKSNLENLPANDIGTYWPEDVLPPARQWVTGNIRNGLISQAYQDLELTIENKRDNPAIKVVSLTGGIHFEKASVTYLEHFPEVTNVSGVAKFDKNSFDITIHEGVYEDIALKPSRILIDGFRSQAEIDIELNLDAPIRTALNLVNNEPYNFTRDMPLHNISGDANVVLGFSFPLRYDLEGSDVAVNISANSKNFRWNNIFKTLDFTNGDIRLELDNSGMVVRGDGNMDGAPLNLIWQSFFGHDLLDSVLEASGSLDVSEVFSSGFTDLENLRGRFPISIKQESFKNGEKKLNVMANIADIGFSVPKIDLNKPVGMSGNVELDVFYQNERIRNISNINFKTPLLSFTGDIRFNESDQVVNEGDQYRWSRAVLNNIRYDRNSFSLIAENMDAHMQVEIQGDQFDISKYIQKKDNPRSTTMGMSADRPSVELQPIKLMGKINRLVTYEDHAIHMADVFLEQNNRGQLQRLELNGTVGQGQIYVRYRPDEQNLQSLRMEADDAGSALRALGVTNSIRGGVLIIDGRPIGVDRPRDMAGRFQISHFSAVNAPVLARLLNGLSITGLSSLLSGQGIDFAKLEGEFIWQESSQGDQKNLRLQKGRTSGASLGLTFDGNIDLTRSIIDLEGNIVPVSGLNRAVGQIPVFGDLLTGGGDAVFAATYSLRGDTKSPTVTVNPLAALAPGVFRTLFFEGGGEF